MRFDACFCTNSLCTPRRATILTGTYSHVNGVDDAGHAVRRAPADVRDRAPRRPATAPRSSASGTSVDGGEPRPAGLRPVGRCCPTRASTTTRGSSPPRPACASPATPPTSSPTSPSTGSTGVDRRPARGACWSTTRRRTARGSPTQRTPGMYADADPAAGDASTTTTPPCAGRRASARCASPTT